MNFILPSLTFGASNVFGNNTIQTDSSTSTSSSATRATAALTRFLSRSNVVVSALAPNSPKKMGPGEGPSPRTSGTNNATNSNNSNPNGGSNSSNSSSSSSSPSGSSTSSSTSSTSSSTGKVHGTHSTPKRASMSVLSVPSDRNLLRTSASSGALEVNPKNPQNSGTVITRGDV